MGQIADIICGPLLKMIEERIINNDIQRRRLIEKKRELIAFVEQARIEKVHREQEQARVKEEPVASTSKVHDDQEQTEVKEPDVSTSKVHDEQEQTEVKKSVASTFKVHKEQEQTKVKELFASTSTEKSLNETLYIKLEPEKENREKSPVKKNMVEVEDLHLLEKSAIAGDSLTNISGTSADNQSMREPKPALIKEQKETDKSNNNDG